MGKCETRLEAARRRVFEQELLIDSHKRSVSSPQTEGKSTEIDEKMLGALERTLEKFRGDVARLLN